MNEGRRGGINDGSEAGDAGSMTRPIWKERVLLVPWREKFLVAISAERERQRTCFYIITR